MKIPAKDTLSAPLHSHKDNQVFINFRGEELPSSFVSHLVDAFKRDGINFFIDKDEQKGKDRKHLFARIKQSRIALTIFSKRYAESRWCLNELAKIKKRADKRKLQVIPIFFKVKAASVRYQKATFGRNFWRLAKNSSGEQIMKWKEALESVSDKMGLSLDDKRYLSHLLWHFSGFLVVFHSVKSHAPLSQLPSSEGSKDERDSLLPHCSYDDNNLW